MSRRDRIITLLENYVDVENGLIDRDHRGSCSTCVLAAKDRWLCEKYGCANEGINPRMSRAWSHPSYRELRRLIGVMQSTQPRTFWHVAERFFRYRERRVSFCPRCQSVGESKYAGTLHRHGQRTVAVVPRVIRVYKLVNRNELERGIDWLVAEFQGEPFVPDDLLALVA